jgi:hypothetical protein
MRSALTEAQAPEALARWSTLGLRVAASGSAMSQSHAMLPTPWLLEDRIRVFYATCDADLRGRVVFADLARTPPYAVIGVEERPALDLGPPGAFDCDGVNPSQVIAARGAIQLLYIGWRRDVDGAPYTLLTGLAQSRDGGRSFERRRAPLLPATLTEPLFRTAPFATRGPGGWELLYIGGDRFLAGETRPLPLYALRRMRSPRLDRWPAAGEALLAPDLSRGEIGFGRPVIWRPETGEPVLIVSRRTRLGYEMLQAPLSGVEAGRPAFSPVLGDGRDDWDSDMTCFGAPLRVDGRDLLFYNGNQYGRTGFGIAARDPH